MLCLRLELLCGRYSASCIDDRNAAEWPPHPARVFSALVAAHYDGAATEAGAQALRWLERQDPPDLHFSELSDDASEVRKQGPTFVPVNDKAVSDTAAVSKAWQRLFLATGEKAREKAESKLRVEYEKAGAPLKKLPKNAAAQGRHVLPGPGERTRQARSFPTITPADPIVQLVWNADASAEHLAALTEICRTLSRVGHSSSMVAASWTDVAPQKAPTWYPSSEGSKRLRWVCEGQLAALDALHCRAPFGEQRVMPYTVARYERRPPPAVVPSSVFSSTFIVLHKLEGPRVSVHDAASVAEKVRAALMSNTVDPVPSVISGHHGGTEEKDVSGDHLAVVPLPYVASRYANGDVLGVGLVLPRTATAEDRAALFAAIRGWEDNGADLRMGKLGRWKLKRPLGESPLRNLREKTWSTPSCQWATVTPVLFDRHPGNIGDQKPSRRRAAIRKSHAIIVRACHRIGLPTPEEIEFSHSPFVRGSAIARAFRSPPNRRDPRPKLHVRLRFATPVQGPILLGAGRFRGLGLFRPQTDQGVSR